MAQNVTVAGASYTSVPAVDLPKTGGGTATFTDTSPTTAVESDVASGKIFFKSDGSQATGTASGGGGTTVIIPQQTINVNDAYNSVSFLSGLVDGEDYIITINGVQQTETAWSPGGNTVILYTNISNLVFEWTGSTMYLDANSSSVYGTYTIKVEQSGGGGGGAVLITKNITANGTYDAEDDNADGYSQVTVNVSGGTSKNTQTVQSTSRRNNTSLGSITSLTCSTTGSYDVYWTCARSNTSQTWGSQLYIGGSSYGTENTTWSNNVQNNHLENVSISANQTVAVYGRSRSGYYIYAPQLTIVQK